MTSVEQAFRLLYQALHQFEKTGEQLGRALRLLESVARSKDPDKID
ncbi:MAG: hypothetical protein ACLFVT_10190 [Syntrophobacteria bacterium]